MEICGNMWKFIDDLYMNIIYEVNMNDLCVVSEIGRASCRERV